MILGKLHIPCEFGLHFLPVGVKVHIAVNLPHNFRQSIFP